MAFHLLLFTFFVFCFFVHTGKWMRPRADCRLPFSVVVCIVLFSFRTNWNWFTLDCSGFHSWIDLSPFVMKMHTRSISTNPDLNVLSELHESNSCIQLEAAATGFRAFVLKREKWSEKKISENMAAGWRADNTTRDLFFYIRIISEANNNSNAKCETGKKKISVRVRAKPAAKLATQSVQSLQSYIIK